MGKTKVALITGSSRGIGLEIAKMMLNEGYRLTVLSRKKENLMRMFQNDQDVLPIECDVSSLYDLQTAVDMTMEKFSRIDVLINNAGINIRKDFEDTKIDDWERMMDTNLKSSFFLTKYVGDVMFKQKDGNIINISSVLGIKPDSVSVLYGISKSALIMMTKYVAKLYAPHVRVNCIAPGFVDTDWHKDKSPDRINKITQQIPLKRFAQAKEIAELCLFLITKGHYFTGETIVIDGGYSLT